MTLTLYFFGATRQESDLLKNLLKKKKKKKKVKHKSKTQYIPSQFLSRPSWYPNVTEKVKKKTQIMKNKCIRFCLRRGKMHHISEEDFRLINWLPISKRIN